MKLNSKIKIHEATLIVNSGDGRIYCDTVLRSLDDRCLNEVVEDPQMVIISRDSSIPIKCGIWIENDEWYPIIKFKEDQKFTTIEDWIFYEQLEATPQEIIYINRQLDSCKQLAAIIEDMPSWDFEENKYIRMPKIDEIIVPDTSKYCFSKLKEPKEFGYLANSVIYVLDEKGLLIEKLNLPISYIVNFPEELIGKRVLIRSNRVIPESYRITV